MAITLQIKKSTASTAPSSLADGELAYTHGAGTQINNGKTWNKNNAIDIENCEKFKTPEINKKHIKKLILK